ncbi:MULTISPECIES: hypothetical protein [Pyrococcus]|nr:hypothetical protein [Pyrococcus furiosus]
MIKVKLRWLKMPIIGFAEVNATIHEIPSLIMENLKEFGIEVSFYRHHWAGDLPFGLLIIESNKGPLAIRWHFGKKFSLRLEEVSEEAFEEFVEETLDYLGGD